VGDVRQPCFMYATCQWRNWKILSIFGVTPATGCQPLVQQRENEWMSLKIYRWEMDELLYNISCYSCLARRPFPTDSASFLDLASIFTYTPQTCTTDRYFRLFSTLPSRSSTHLRCSRSNFAKQNLQVRELGDVTCH